VPTGQSAIIAMPTGDPGAGPPTPPVSLAANGLQSFTVVALAPTIASPPTSQIKAPGQDVTFSVTAAGVAPLSYQWRHEGTNLPGATFAEYAKANVQSTDTCEYLVVITNFYGAITSAVATLTLDLPVNYSLVVTANPVGKVTVDPDLPIYPRGTLVTLTAPAMLPDFVFSQWSPASLGTANPLTIAMDSDKSITAFYDFVVPDIIVDNPVAGFTGVWTSDSRSTDQYGLDYRYILSSVSSVKGTATFTPLIVIGGMYDVDAWWPTVSNPAAASGVPYVINSGATMTNVTVDQRSNPGTWNRLVSRQAFAPGTNGFVRILNNTGQNNRKVLADAVRFVYSANQPLPPIIQSVTTAAGQATITWLASTGVTYRVEYKSNLNDVLWSSLTPDIIVNTATTNLTDTTLGSAKQRFYRVTVP